MSRAFQRLSSQVLQKSFAPKSFPACQRLGLQAYHSRPFSTTRTFQRDQYEEKAMKLNQKGLDEQEQQVRVRQHQVQRPWHREDADKPPADMPDKEPEPVIGKLLTTPTRLLKLVLPLPLSIEKDKENNSLDYGRSISSNQSIQPLALLIHPQQPLSYVERLIQAEIPPVIEDGKEKIPNVYFRAEDAERDDAGPISKVEAKKRREKDAEEDAEMDGEKGAETDADPMTHVESYSGLGHEGPERKSSEKNWVRWSSSTEVGDFIRDAARGREFAIEVEGYNLEMRVTVPSFNDRTHYMRVRLRRMSKEIEQLAEIKRECDLLAHQGAHRLAKGGFGLLTAWWGVVYYCSFHTDAGWDLVEPVTYLAGLSTIMGGYLWFLYISRDLSYKAAMNVTVSRRQTALYEARGFDIEKWEHLVREANALRSEVKVIAVEYDVDWEEAKEVGEEVKEVLDEEKSKRKDQRRKKEKEEDENLTEEKKAKDKGGEGDKRDD